MKRILVLLSFVLTFQSISFAQESGKVKSIANSVATRSGGGDGTNNSTQALPPVISYQGILTDASGNPVADGNYQVTFRTYPVSTGGIASGTFGPLTVTTVRGLFATELVSWNIEFFRDPLAQNTWIGVTVGSNPELTPRVRLTAVPYAFSADYANYTDSARVAVSTRSLLLPYVQSSSVAALPIISVSNTAATGWGIIGTTFAPLSGGLGYAGVVGRSNATTDGVGVLGRATGTNSSGVLGIGDGAGVQGTSGTATGVGVLAQNLQNVGTALEISGGIKVTGTNARPVFLHISTAANISSNQTAIDNALCNGDQNAMLIVTHSNNPPGVAGASFNKAFGVFWNGTRWAIYTEDGTAFPAGIGFNVLIIKR
jgi:hypothetical protein